MPYRRHMRWIHQHRIWRRLDKVRSCWIARHRRVVEAKWFVHAIRTAMALGPGQGYRNPGAPTSRFHSFKGTFYLDIFLWIIGLLQVFRCVTGIGSKWCETTCYIFFFKTLLIKIPCRWKAKARQSTLKQTILFFSETWQLIGLILLLNAIALSFLFWLSHVNITPFWLLFIFSGFKRKLLNSKE